MSRSYAALTRDDPNPLKRWVQRRRLGDALKLAGPDTPALVVDYGAGDAALTAMAAERWPAARFICFEPVESLADEARAALAHMGQAVVVGDEAEIASGSADLVFCTEVFEHLPAVETDRALGEIVRVLRTGGRLVLGVPVEVGPPAAAKGAFRMARRAGAFDARIGPIAAAAAGRPPLVRETAEVAPGRPYFPHHLGFDHRRLFQAVGALMTVERTQGSPLSALPLALNSEAYLVARKR